MNWIELIEIRVSQKLTPLIEHELDEVIQDMKAKKMVQTLKVFNQANLKSDFLVIIFHSDSLHDLRVSELGDRLVDAFQEYGMIHRSIWNELNSIRITNDKITPGDNGGTWHDA
jgi:hypothetical protein